MIKNFKELLYLNLYLTQGKNLQYFAWKNVDFPIRENPPISAEKSAKNLVYWKSMKNGNLKNNSYNLTNLLQEKGDDVLSKPSLHTLYIHILYINL